MTAKRLPVRQIGVTMIEVLVTMLIMAFGLLGLAALHSRAQLAELESYQRAQAVLLLDDMVQRLSNNNTPGVILPVPPLAQIAASPAYVTGSPYGKGNNSWPASCTGFANSQQRDQCEWNNSLLGAAETQASTRLGAMTDARGCIQELQRANTTPGVCLPGIYRVSVAWQGIHETVAPAAQLTCGQNQYGDERFRRVITGIVEIGLNQCQE